MKDFQLYLERNFDILTFNLRPTDEFFVWLIYKQVFTFSDQEEVQNVRPPTTVFQMVKLIDIIKTKGENGFNAFMEVVEYSFPEVFECTLGEPPRPPSEEYRRRFKIPSSTNKKDYSNQRQSIAILEMMGNLIQTLTTDKLNNKSHVSELQQYVSQMEESVRREKSDLYMQLKGANEQVRMLQEKNGDLSLTMQKLQKERKELSEELESQRKLKDTYMEKNAELMKQNDDLSNAVKKFSGELESLKRKTTPPIPSGNGAAISFKMPGEKNDRDPAVLKEQLKHAQNQSLVANFEKAQSEDKIKNYRSDISNLQNKVEVLENNLRQMKEERDKCLEQKKELDEKLDEQRGFNAELSNKHENYVNKYSYLESKYKNLQETFEAHFGKIPHDNKLVPQTQALARLSPNPQRRNGMLNHNGLGMVDNGSCEAGRNQKNNITRIGGLYCKPKNGNNQ